MLNDLVDGGVVGMLADFTYGLVNWAQGPCLFYCCKYQETATKIYKRPETIGPAVRQLVQKEVTPIRQVMSLWDKVDRKYINKDNLTKDYYKFRNAAFEFKDNYLNPTWQEKTKR